MKTIRQFILTTICLLAFSGIVHARAVHIWSYQELLAKSDLVVLATVETTNDTKEHIDLPGFAGEGVIGVETKFKIMAVLKGDSALKYFVLHHYRTLDGLNISHTSNGPGFISFSPVKNPILTPRTYILFLQKESDGRYAPVVGQSDPGLSVRELKPADR